MSHLTFDRRVSLNQLEAAFMKQWYLSLAVGIKGSLGKLNGSFGNICMLFMADFFCWYVDNYHVKRKRMVIAKRKGSERSMSMFLKQCRTKYFQFDLSRRKKQVAVLPSFFLFCFYLTGIY